MIGTTPTTVVVVGPPETIEVVVVFPPIGTVGGMPVATVVVERPGWVVVERPGWVVAGTVGMGTDAMSEGVERTLGAVVPNANSRRRPGSVLTNS